MSYIQIGNRKIGVGHPTYVIAEMSANHRQDYAKAVAIMEAAKEAGADAVKLQAYTADSMTIDSAEAPFQISGGTLWDNRTLYDLYQEGTTPRDWFPKLKVKAEEMSIDLFSTAFAPSEVAFLEDWGAAVHKVSSFELVDVPLIKEIARTGKPMIMSTGAAPIEEIEEAVDTARQAGASQIALLWCTSEYPARPDTMNLLTLPDLAERFGVPVGLSDHSLGTGVAVAAVALGACIVEKHLTLSRSIPSLDAAFSMEPDEFTEMVRGIRAAEAALGSVDYGVREGEQKHRSHKRSLFVIEDVKAGEAFTEHNVRSIRPADGLHPRALPEVLGRKAARDIQRGTPLQWEHLGADGSPVRRGRNS